MTSGREGSALDELSALDVELDDEERLVRASVRRFVRERYLPRAAELYAREEFPRDLVPELAELGVLGASITGYGCAGMSPVAYGLMLEELEYGDSGLRSFTSVQGSLAMFALHAFGSEAQRQRYLPEMARGRLIGCFGLTEPDSGSDGRKCGSPTPRSPTWPSFGRRWTTAARSRFADSSSNAGRPASRPRASTAK
jgi:glutaryl-CoA dehydrogenase